MYDLSQAFSCFTLVEETNTDATSSLTLKTKLQDQLGVPCYAFEVNEAYG